MTKTNLTCPCEEYEYTVSYKLEDNQKPIKPTYCVFCGAEFDDPIETSEDEEDNDWLNDE